MQLSSRVTPAIIVSFFLLTSCSASNPLRDASTGSDHLYTHDSAANDGATSLTDTTAVTDAAAIGDMTFTHDSGTTPLPLDPAKVYPIWLSDYPQARCNDGSSGIYFYSPGKGADINKWIIILMGGGACFNNEGCAQRVKIAPELMSSNQYQQTTAPMSFSGMFSRSAQDNPDFYRFNRVRVHYCSSDTWAGRAGASAATDQRFFRGRRIVESVIASLQSGKHTGGRKLSDATEVLLVGTSAGAIGVQGNLDRVGELLGTQIKLRAISDAMWRPDNLAQLGLEPAIWHRGDAGMNFWNGQRDASCLQALTSNDACLGEVLRPHLSHDIFVIIDQSDPTNNNYTDPADRLAYKGAVRDSFGGLKGYASPDNGQHGLLSTNQWMTMKINNVLIRDVIANWYFNRTGVKTMVEVK